MTAKTTKRRRRGEGMFRQRPDGRWEWRDPRTQTSYYASTSAALTTKMREVLGAEAIRNERQKLSVSVFFKSWLAHKATNVRPNTLQSYSVVVSTHITPIIGKVRLHKLTPLDIQQLLDGIKRSPSTIEHVRMVLRMALAWAVLMELIRRNPAEAIKPPKRPRPDIQPFDEKELAAFREAAPADPHEAIWLLGVGCGLRMGEIRGAWWSDFDLERGTFTVSRTHQPCGTLAPKSDESRRIVTVPRVVVAALKRWRTRQLESRMKAGEKWAAGEWVFTSSRGTPIEKRRLDRLYKRYLKSAGIKDHRFHDMRHSYATHALSNGVDVKLVSEQLGHASVAFTLTVYAHVLKSKARASADVMDKLLGG